MSNHHPLKALLLLLAGFFCVPLAGADDRGFGSMRSREYDRGGYYGPRTQPVLPTRPFFVQPYPRNDSQHDGRRAYRHGYREGYRDGYSEHDDRGRGRGHHNRRHGHDRHDNHHGRGFDSYYQPDNRHYYGGQPNYYAPRPGFSIHYDNR